MSVPTMSTFFMFLSASEKRNRNKFVRVLIFMFFASCLPAPDACARGALYTHVAVIGQPDVRASGLSDLVGLKLQEKGIRLVEREEIDAISDERMLSLFAGMPASIAMRRLTQADALVLLSFVQNDEGHQSVKVVIGDCHYGARLSIDMIPYQPLALEKTADQIALTVVRTRAHFPEGVKCIVGLTPFVCNNLVHDYDLFQSGYAYLLGTALSRAAGVAVFELEEALKLQQEMALSGTTADDRTTYLLVKGNYTVIHDDGSREPDVEFHVLLTGKPDGKEETINRRVELNDVNDFLTVALTDMILKRIHIHIAESFSAKEQFQWLTERAAVFSGLGDWQNAVGHREAALLLVPNDMDQHLKTIAEYYKIFSIYQKDIKSTFQQDVKTIQNDVNAYLACLSHLEHLIRNRGVEFEQAVALLKFSATNELTRVWKGGQSEKDLIEIAEAAKREFIVEMIPVFLSFPRDDIRQKKYREANLLNSCLAFFAGSALYRADRGHKTRDDLDFFRILMERMPDHTSSFQGITNFIEFVSKHCYDDPEHRCFEGLKPDPREQWLSFLRALAGSRHEMASLYGRFGLLISEASRISKETALEQYVLLINQFQKLKEDFVTTPHLYGTWGSENRENEWLYRVIDGRQSYLVSRCKKLYPTYVPPQNISKKAFDQNRSEKTRFDGMISASLNNQDSNALKNAQDMTPKTVDRVSFQKLDIQFQKSDGSYVPVSETRNYLPIREGGGRFAQIERIASFENSFDVWWGDRAVLVMLEKDRLKTLLINEGAGISDVRWDGENLWIASRHKGIWVMTLTGEILFRIEAQKGLPPADHNLLIYPTGDPLKMFAVGSFGEHKRAWCAIIDCSGEDLQIDIFHRATYVPSGNWLYIPGDRPDMVFSPAWIHKYDTGNAGDNILLVGRNTRGREPGRFPLEVDLNNRRAMVFNLCLLAEAGDAPFVNGMTYFSKNGELLEASTNYVKHYPPWNKTFPDGELQRYLCVAPDYPYDFYRILLNYQGWLYLPGERWYRINKETMRDEPLPSKEIESIREMDMSETRPYPTSIYYTTSAFYGLLGWEINKWNFYRFIIDGQNHCQDE